MTPLQCVFSNDVQNEFLQQNTCTKCTYICIHLCVCYVVVNQIFLSKAFFTGAEFIWFLSCVYSLLVTKITSFSYAFVTMSAIMWLLSRVFSGSVLKDFLQQINFHKGCFYTAFPIYVFSGV